MLATILKSDIATQMSIKIMDAFVLMHHYIGNSAYRISNLEARIIEQDIMKYNKQYRNLKVIYDNTFHDRYFILDDQTFYHCGSSINRICYKTFSITLINDIEICEILINKITKIINLKSNKERRRIKNERK